MIEMGITRPDLDPGPTPQDPEQGAIGRGSGSARVHAYAREGDERRVLTLPVPRGNDAELVPVVDDAALVGATRTRGSGALARVRSVSGRWVGEARVTVGAALDGSVWRARPAALRDIHARTQRGEWAGDSNALLLAGQVYGYVALALVAGLYAAAEVVKRPLRLLMVAVIVLIVVVAVRAGGSDTAAGGQVSDFPGHDTAGAFIAVTFELREN